MTVTLTQKKNSATTEQMQKPYTLKELQQARDSQSKLLKGDNQSDDSF